MVRLDVTLIHHFGLDQRTPDIKGNGLSHDGVRDGPHGFVRWSIGEQALLLLLSVRIDCGFFGHGLLAFCKLRQRANWDHL